MTWDEFWYGDIRLLESAQKAYYRNVCFNAWIIGSNMNVALAKFYSNFNAKTKGQINWKWIDFVDPIEKLEKKKPKITKDNIESEFRRQQVQSEAFIQKILHRS